MGDLARSSSRSLSPRLCRKAPSLLEGTTTVPPCWWDEEYPKQQLRRSMSDRRPRISPTKLGTRARQRTTKEFRSSSSLWSAENREYLEMRFGLIQQSSNKEAPKHGVDDDASPMKKVGEHECGELKAEWEKKKRHSASASSDEASSIFSNPDCSSFSSGSDVSSIAKEEPSSPRAAERPAAAASSHEQNPGFLEFDLVEGHLVAESAPGEAAEDELPPAAAQDGLSSGISPNSSDKKKALRLSSRPLPHSSFVHDDRYPVWASNRNWHLVRSYKERIVVGPDGGKRCSERKQVARRLLRGCSPVSHHMFHMIPGSLFSPRIGLRGCSSPPPFALSPETSEFRTSSSPAPKVGDVFGKNSSESGSDTELHQQQRLKHSASRAAALNSKLVSITRKRQQQQQQQRRLVAEEPEVSCRPFLPIAAKKSCLSRRPLFSLRKKKCPSEATEPSSSSKEISVRQAHLHCVVRHDHHSYTFVVDGSDELLVARTGEGRGASCSFYSWKQKRKPKSRSWKSAWSSRREDPKPESELVGSMRLSKKFCNTKSGSIDLEFVLLKGCSSTEEEENQEQVLQMGSPSRLSFSSWDTSWLRKSPCSSSSTKALRDAHQRSNPWWYVGQSPVQTSPARARMKKSLSQNCSPSRGKIDDDNMDVLRDLWMQMEAAELKKREETTDESCSQSQQSEEELAAFVITVPSAKKKRNWTDDQQYHETHDEHNKMSSNSMMNVTVILPVGHHGLPSDGSGGPRPLIERWRSAGKCDCGSWDLGCALNILQQQQKQEHSNLLKVSLQGSSKQQQEVLNLVALRNGLFSVSFKEPLLPLQAFAAAVAILRSNERREDFMGMLHSRAPLQALDGFAAFTPWSKASGIPCSNNALERL